MQQVVAEKVVGEDLDGAAYVLRQDLKRVGDFRRELANAEVAVEENRPHIRAPQQVIHIVGQLGQLRYLPLVLRID
jgi:hypothetical protein